MATAGWAELLEVVEELFSATGRQAFDELCRFRCAGLRLSVPIRAPTPTAEQIERTAPGRPQVAAVRLGIDRSTAYRILQRQRRLIR